MAASRIRAPLWFTVAAVLLLLLWGLAGLWAFWLHVTIGPAGMGQTGAYDLHVHASRPGWFDWVYAAATGGGALGAAALLVRSRWAVPLFAVSLVAVIVQFGWVFLATDLIAVKGAAATLPFPLVILAAALFQLALAITARARGWIA